MNKSTWIVAALMVVLGLIYFFTREDQASVGIKRLKMPVFVVEKINKIEILGKDPVRISKKDGMWLLNIGDIEKPMLVEADSENIESMLIAAQGVKHSHYVTNIKEKYEDLGLGSTAVTINLMENDKVVWSILLGKSASGSTHYAKVPNEDDVYVVKGSFWQLTRNGPNDWRERQILPITEDMVTALTIKRDDGTFLIEKRGANGSWSFSSSQKGLPPGFKADSAALSGLVHSMVSMSASDFIDKEVNLLDPKMKVKLLADKSDYDIEIYSGQKDDYLVKRLSDGRIFSISKNSFDSINKSMEDVRDLSIFDFDKNSVKSLKIRHGKEIIIIAKDKDKDSFEIKEPKLPADFQFDKSTVDGMLSLLSNLDATRSKKSGDTPKDPKALAGWLVLIEFEKEEPLALYVAANKANADEMLIKSQKSETFIIKASRLKTLFSGINAFKKEEFDFPPIDENTQGFNDLPEDVKRKILDAVKNKK